MAGTTFIKKVVIGTPIKRVQETLNIGDFRNFDTTGRQDGYILAWDSANTNFVPRDSASLEILKVTDRITSDSGANLVLDPGGDNAITGKVIIRGDLQIDGTETIVNSTTLSINDKNIILADSAVDSAAANGAGLTIEGANATITYDATSDQFKSNKGFDIHHSSDFNTLTARNINVTKKINVADGGPTFAAGDSASLTVGSNDDLVFYHDGDTTPSYKRGSFIVNRNDDFHIFNDPAGPELGTQSGIYIENYSLNGYVIIRATGPLNGERHLANYLVADPYNGEVSLWYGNTGSAGAVRLTTKSHGINITGKLNVDSAAVSGNLDVGGAFTTITTTGLTEGNNLYYTTARADSDARHAISAAGDLSYNSSTGVFSFDVEQVYTKANFDSDFNMSIDEASLGGVGIAYDATTNTLSIDSAELESNYKQDIRGYFTAGGDLSYDAATGNFSFDVEQVYTKSNFDSDLGAALDGGTGITYDSSNDTISITNTGVTAATYGLATQIPKFTVNAQGQIDSAGFVTPATVTGFTWDSATSVATISTADNQTFPLPIRGFGDDQKLNFGDANEASITHKSTGTTVFEAGAMEIDIDGAKQLLIKNNAGGAKIAEFHTFGAVDLYHGSIQRFATDSYGSTIFGRLIADSATLTNITGTLQTAAQPNITSLGTLTGLTSTGSVNADSATFTNITGTLQTAAQPNITSLGTLTGLTSTGDVVFDSAGAVMFDLSDKALEVNSSLYSINLADNARINFGNSQDGYLEHSGNFMRMVNTNGGISIRNEYAGFDVEIRTDDGTGTDTTTYFRADGSTGQVKLYYYGSERLKTIDSGVNITGKLTADSATFTNITGTGDVTFDSAGAIMFDKSDQALEFGDDYKASFGAGGDLVIRHQKSNNTSYIEEAGAGDLVIKGHDVYIQNAAGTENMAIFVEDAGVSLKYNNATKLETNLYGTTVTGSLSADSATFTKTTAVTANANTFGDGLIYSTSSADSSISGTTTTFMDTFAVASISTRKYIATVTNGTKLQSSEMLLIGNATNAYLTTYAIVNTDSDLGTFTADLNSGSARLKFTPTLAGTNTIKLMFTDISV